MICKQLNLNASHCAYYFFGDVPLYYFGDDSHKVLINMFMLVMCGVDSLCEYTLISFAIIRDICTCELFFETYTSLMCDVHSLCVYFNVAKLSYLRA